MTVQGLINELKKFNPKSTVEFEYLNASYNKRNRGGGDIREFADITVMATIHNRIDND